MGTIFQVIIRTIIITIILECEEKSIRLVDGSSPESGRLEVCEGGTWGSVCSYSKNGNLSLAAAVVCRQLGINATRGRSHLFLTVKDWI